MQHLFRLIKVRGGANIGNCTLQYCGSSWKLWMEVMGRDSKHDVFAMKKTSFRLRQLRPDRGEHRQRTKLRGNMLLDSAGCRDKFEKKYKLHVMVMKKKEFFLCGRMDPRRNRTKRPAITSTQVTEEGGAELFVSAFGAFLGARPIQEDAPHFKQLASLWELRGETDEIMHK